MSFDVQRELENNYVRKRWKELSIEAKRLLAASLQERAFLVLLWRLEYRDWLDSKNDERMNQWT